jgi:Tol biopolymer transport system component
MTDVDLTRDTTLRFYEVSSRGGEPKLRVQPRESEKGVDFLTPSFLPDGNNYHVLLFSVSQAKPEIMLEDLKTGQVSAIVEGAWPAYSPSGHIVYQRSVFGNGIWALPFSMKSMKRTGEPFRVAENGSYPSVASDGTLVYLEEFPRTKILVWRNRDGVKSGEIGQPQKDMFLPSLSPDGRRVGVEGIEANTGEDIWIHDVAASAKTRVTLDPARDTRPIWSPDGREIVYTSNRNGAFQIFLTS